MTRYVQVTVVSFSFYKIKQGLIKFPLTIASLPFICPLKADRSMLENACAVFT